MIVCSKLQSALSSNKAAFNPHINDLSWPRSSALGSSREANEKGNRVTVDEYDDPTTLKFKSSKPLISGPPSNAIYELEINIPVIGKQRFLLEIIHQGLAKLTIEGILQLNDLIYYEIDQGNGDFAFNLSKMTKQILTKFRTSLIKVKYCQESDSPVVVVRPPLPTDIELRLKRQTVHASSSLFWLILLPFQCTQNTYTKLVMKLHPIDIDKKFLFNAFHVWYIFEICFPSRSNHQYDTKNILNYVIFDQKELLVKIYFILLIPLHSTYVSQYQRMLGYMICRLVLITISNSFCHFPRHSLSLKH